MPFLVEIRLSFGFSDFSLFVVKYWPLKENKKQEIKYFT